MASWENKIFTIYDDLNYRINRCCGTRRPPAAASPCGTCQLDGQLRAMLVRYIDAGKIERPGGMIREAVRETIDDLFHEAVAGEERR